MFKHLLRKSVMTAVVSGLGVLALSTAPAYAVPGVAAGVVTGTVGLSPGLGGGGTAAPLICSSQTFNFNPITIAGAMVAAPSVAAGTIVTVPVTGGTTGNVLGCPQGGSGENLLSARGSVNAFTFSGGGVGSVTGGCSGGAYTRIGEIVLVTLNCFATVTTPVVGTNTTSALTVVVPALFQPDTVGQNGVTNVINHATFAGLFVGAGAA